MKISKKFAFFASAIMVASLLLTACGTAPQKTDASTSGQAAQAVKFPTKEVKVWIPAASGDTRDLAARAMGQEFQKLTGQPLVVEDHAGGAGIPGTTQFIKNAPDGYNISIQASGELCLRPLLAKVEYQYPRDFTPIIGLAQNEMVFTVKADAPYKTFAEMIKYFKDHHQALRVGNPGANTDAYLVGKQIGQLTGIEINLMPFNSTGEMVTNLLGGHADLAIGSITAFNPAVQAGQLKVIGANNDKRYADLPDVSTLKEQGYDFSISGGSWFAFYGPADMPKEVVAKLQDVLKQCMQSDQFVKFAKDQHLVVDMRSPEEITKDLKTYGDNYAKMLKK